MQLCISLRGSKTLASPRRSFSRVMGHLGLLLCVLTTGTVGPRAAAQPNSPLVLGSEAHQDGKDTERPPDLIAESKVALVIGNAGYQHAPKLLNPAHDAEDVAIRLRSFGFEVVERHDLTVRNIGSTLREFRSHLDRAAIGLVFIAGHGLQVNGENYFPAIDADINGEDDVPTQSLSLNQLLDLLTSAKTRLNLLFLDTCRDNPFSLGTRSGTRGLAPVNAPSGTVISYATRPGSVANDGKGRNGLYTGELLRQMDEVPDLPIELVFKRIVAGVRQTSEGRQEPWWEGSMEGNFCFGTCRDDSAVELARTPTQTRESMSSVSARPLKTSLSKKVEHLPAPVTILETKPDSTPVAVSIANLDPIWFNRTITRTETGRVYRLEAGRAWQAYTRTIAGNGSISSMAEGPNGEMYVCDATESRILRFNGNQQTVLYQHTGTIKHVAIGPAGHLFFSSVNGLHNGGTIFELIDAKSRPYRVILPEELPKGWIGTFAFDPSGMLWVSSGNTSPGGLYRVRGSQLELMYTTTGGGILGFAFLQDGSILYADGVKSVFHLSLPAFDVQKVFESPFEGPLTDVAVARPALLGKAGG